MARRSATRSERRLAAVQQRRKLASARSATARRALRRRRRLRTLAVLATLAVAASIIAAITLRPEKQPSKELRAERVPGAVGPLAMSALPTTYRAVYRAESYEGSKVTVTTEDISVQRPFDGRVFIREGEPPGGAVQFAGRSSFGMYGNYTETTPRVAGDAPTVALGDLRLAASLDALVSQGLFELRERRRLSFPAQGGARPQSSPAQGGARPQSFPAQGGGRPQVRECQVYRTGSPVQTLKITAPTATDYVDACLDDTGLLLEEVTVAAGKAVQRLTATTIERDVTFDPAIFAIEGERVGPDQGGAEVTEVDRTAAPPAGYWSLDGPPPGYSHRGRYTVAAQGTSSVDVYVRGIDIVTVRQGPPAAEPDVSDAPPGADVELGALGSTKVVPSSIGPAIIAHPGGDAFVHVTGTVSPAELQAIAAGLRRG